MTPAPKTQVVARWRKECRRWTRAFFQGTTRVKHESRTRVWHIRRLHGHVGRAKPRMSCGAAKSSQAWTASPHSRRSVKATREADTRAHTTATTRWIHDTGRIVSLTFYSWRLSRRGGIMRAHGRALAGRPCKMGSSQRAPPEVARPSALPVILGPLRICQRGKHPLVFAADKRRSRRCLTRPPDLLSELASLTPNRILCCVASICPLRRGWRLFNLQRALQNPDSFVETVDLVRPSATRERVQVAPAGMTQHMRIRPEKEPPNGSGRLICGRMVERPLTRANGDRDQHDASIAGGMRASGSQSDDAVLSRPRFEPSPDARRKPLFAEAKTMLQWTVCLVG